MSLDTLKLLAAVSTSCAAYGALALSLRSRRRGARPGPATGVVLALMAVVLATLLPWGDTDGSKLRLDPMSDLDDLQALVNVLLFVPLGGFLALLGRWSWVRVSLGAAALSVAVEVLQFLLISGRYASVGDVILNVSGAVIGYALVSRWGTPITR